jgi:hypothetical protein
MRTAAPQPLTLMWSRLEAPFAGLFLFGHPQREIRATFPPQVCPDRADAKI